MTDVIAANDTKRKFPFATTTQKKDVNGALRLFEVLWHAHELRGGTLTTKDMQNVFHSCISDALSYADGGWRCGKYWSQEAWAMACAAKKHSGLGLKCEHVVPRSCVLAHAMEVITSYADAKQFVIESSFVCVVTTEENNRLNKAGFANTHPQIDAPWRRYMDVNPPIKVSNVPNFLSEAEQTALEHHGLLVAPGECMQASEAED